MTAALCPSPRSPRAASRVRHGALLGLVVMVAGCALPRSGPSSADFSRAGASAQIQLVEVTPQDVAASRVGPEATGFSDEWKHVSTVLGERIGSGDQLDFTILERDGLGMFVAGPSGTARLEALPVDSAGIVQFPFVGAVHVGGLTLAEARRAVLMRLRNIAVSTDVTVAFAKQGSQFVYLQGDVAKPGAILLAPETNRVASLLSAAIAGQALPEQTQVTVRRGSMSASARLSDIMERPDQSIALLPGDFVTVRNLQGAVSVLGASGAQGRVKISKAGYRCQPVGGLSHAVGQQDRVGIGRAQSLPFRFPQSGPDRVGIVVRAERW